MKRTFSIQASWRRYSIIGVVLALTWLAYPATAAGNAIQLDLDGPLGVATAEYLIDGIKAAADDGTELIILRIDTPGGLVDPTRDIIQAILASPVPVVSYVSPGGARAASAGTYILLASHVAAMAPTTSLGAATPVSLGGGDADDGGGFGDPPEPAEPDGGSETDGESDAEPDAVEDSRTPAPADSAMDRKVLNDAIAYIRSLADRHDRNADWAESAVRDAATLTAEDALAQNVIDLVVSNEAELLAALDGQVIATESGDVELATEGMTVTPVVPNWRIKFLSILANPQVALLLLIVGLYGLLFEGYNPGALVPGITGVVCLLLAAYALQVLPVNYVGLALIFVGLLLIVAEAFVPSFGALGLGGIVAFIVGGIILFDSDIPGYSISTTFIVAFSIISGLSLMWLVSYLVRLRSRGAVSGRESMVGAIGRAMEDFNGEGRVWLAGEAWKAHSNHPVSRDQDVIVLGIEGLTLIVRPTGEAAPLAREAH